MYWGYRAPYHAEKAVMPALISRNSPVQPHAWHPMAAPDVPADRMDDVQDKEGRTFFRQEAGSGSR